LEERRGDFDADVAGVLEVEGLTQRDLEDVMRHLRPIKTTFARDWGIPTVVGVALYAAVKLGFPLVQSAYQKFSLGTGPAATKVCVEYDEPNWPPVQSSSHYKEYVTPHELSRLVEQAEKHYIHNFEICSR